MDKQLLQIKLMMFWFSFAFFQFNGYCVCLLCLNSIHKLTLLLKGACEQKVFLWFDDNSFRTIINEPVSCCCFVCLLLFMISVFIGWNFKTKNERHYLLLWKYSAIMQIWIINRIYGTLRFLLLEVYDLRVWYSQ